MILTRQCDRQGPQEGLWLMRARDGKLVRRIAGRRVSTVDWSPNGRRLVFATQSYQSLGGNLYVVSRDGTKRRTLMHRERIADTHPAWSPNGRRIAWISVSSATAPATSASTSWRASWSIRPSGRGPRAHPTAPGPARGRNIPPSARADLAAPLIPDPNHPTGLGASISCGRAQRGCRNAKRRTRGRAARALPFRSAS